jgi:polyhydroxyalkanoate synthesis regulator phasin
MNPDSFVQLLQRGFRITLGATSSLLETLQDPQKRDANLSELKTKWSQQAEDWATKGAVTEEEARNFVDRLWQQRPSGMRTTSSNPPSNPVTVTTPNPDPQAQSEIQDLTAQIATLRAELENLRSNPDSNS